MRHVSFGTGAALSVGSSADDQSWRNSTHRTKIDRPHRGLLIGLDLRRPNERPICPARSSGSVWTVGRPTPSQYLILSYLPTDGFGFRQRPLRSSIPLHPRPTVHMAGGLVRRTEPGFARRSNTDSREPSWMRGNSNGLNVNPNTEVSVVNPVGLISSAAIGFVSQNSIDPIWALRKR